MLGLITTHFIFKRTSKNSVSVVRKDRRAEVDVTSLHATEVVYGTTLASLIARSLTEGEVVRLGQAVLDALGRVFNDWVHH